MFTEPPHRQMEGLFLLRDDCERFGLRGRKGREEEEEE
jgi:hypothetical protein